MTEKLSEDAFFPECPSCESNVFVARTANNHTDFRCEFCDESFNDHRTVLVGKASTRESVYHTHDDCHYVKEHMAEWDREEAEDWGMSWCSHCQNLEGAG